MEDKKDYKIKVTRGDEENQNRQLYKSKSEILRKWLDVCSDICKHGDKNIYEECLVQAFNMCEFVMDNYIEDVFEDNRKSDNLIKIEKNNNYNKNNKSDDVYKFIKQNVEINFTKLINSGFAGKTEILEKLGVKLPIGINEVRKKRNNYAHGTETYKSATREELNSFKTVQRYIDTLGQLLVGMEKLNQEQLRPTYEDLKLQVGKTLGYQGKYVVLGLLKEDEKSRVFEGRNTKSQKEILIEEILPCPELLAIYNGSKEYLQKVMGNGIVRTEDVILKNKACYIVLERIEGIKLYDYLKIHKDDLERKKDLLYQIKKIVNTMARYSGVCSDFCESDFIVDAEGDVWLCRYKFGKQKVGVTEIIRRYEMILDIEPKVEPKVEPKIEPKVEPVKEVEPEIVVPDTPKGSEIEEKVPSRKSNLVDYEMEVMGQESNPNNWYKFFYTVLVCGSILLVLWVISGMFV